MENRPQETVDTLTALERRRGRSWYRLVAASGASWVLDREALEQLGFVPDSTGAFPRPVTRPEVGLLEEAQQATARRRLVRLLAYRARSRQELRLLLGLWPFPQQCVEQALQWAASLGYVDDEALARQLVASAPQRPLGRTGWREHLRQRGIEPELADRAVAELDAGWEREHARKLVAARLRSVAHLAPAQQAARLFGFLVRRGFDEEVARSVVREAVGELPEGQAGHEEAGP